MISVLAETQQSHNSVAVPTVLIVAIIGGTIYVFGYARAVMHRANKDYKTTKAAVPTLRKGFWKAWWSALKVGALIFVAAVLLIAWAGSELRHDQPASDIHPSPSTSAKPVHSRR